MGNDLFAKKVLTASDILKKSNISKGKLLDYHKKVVKGDLILEDGDARGALLNLEVKKKFSNNYTSEIYNVEHLSNMLNRFYKDASEWNYANHKTIVNTMLKYGPNDNWWASDDLTLIAKRQMNERILMVPLDKLVKAVSHVLKISNEDARGGLKYYHGEIKNMVEDVLGIKP